MASQERSVPLETFIKVASEHYVQFPNERTARMLIQMASKIQETESGDKVMIEVPMSDADSGEESETEYEDDEMHSPSEDDDESDDDDGMQTSSDEDDESQPMEICPSDNPVTQMFYEHFQNTASPEAIDAWIYAKKNQDENGCVLCSEMYEKFSTSSIDELLKVSNVYDSECNYVSSYSVAKTYSDKNSGAIKIQLNSEFIH